MCAAGGRAAGLGDVPAGAGASAGAPGTGRGQSAACWLWPCGPHAHIDRSCGPQAQNARWAGRPRCPRRANKPTGPGDIHRERHTIMLSRFARTAWLVPDARPSPIDWGIHGFGRGGLTASLGGTVTPGHAIRSRGSRPVLRKQHVLISMARHAAGRRSRSNPHRRRSPQRVRGREFAGSADVGGAGRDRDRHGDDYGRGFPPGGTGVDRIADFACFTRVAALTWLPDVTGPSGTADQAGCGRSGGLPDLGAAGGRGRCAGGGGEHVPGGRPGQCLR
jgi:hypothetical protein